MTKRLGLFLAATVLLSGCAHRTTVLGEQTRQTVPPVTVHPVLSPTPTPQPVSMPVSIEIPDIKVNAKIEPVGLTPEKRMDVPKGWFEVGWYNLGPRPGEIGSAVLAGHLDTPTGPAIFWRLGELTEGDLIVVRTEEGTTQQFEVVTKATYPDAEFPIETVFAKADGKRLNLITCEGVFNRSSKNYSHRLVIFSRLIE